MSRDFGLEEAHKDALREKYAEKNKWLIANRSFVSYDLETTNLKASIGRVLCASFKPLYDEPYTLAAKGMSDAKLMANVRKELAKYDYVITYYGTGFDMPYTNTRLLIHGLAPLSPYRHVDMYYTARGNLRLHSNKLAVVAETLFGETTKTRVLGPVWDLAASGNRASMQYIIEHCEEDVKELEKVFHALVMYKNLSNAPLKGALV